MLTAKKDAREVSVISRNQDNPLKLRGQEFFVFNVWYIDLHRYLTPQDRTALLTGHPEIKQVPIVGHRKIFSQCPTMEQLLAFSTAPSMINPKATREGIVCKSMQLVDGHLVSFKVLSNDYLLKNEK